MNLTKLARDQECLIRLPTVCSGDRSTTVACHVRMIGLSGAGLKAPDLFIAFGCHACHAACDGQLKSSLTYEQRRLALVEGCLRTQYWLLQRGYIKW